MKPGDLVRYKYYTSRGGSSATGILLGPCNPPSTWYKVLFSRGPMDCPLNTLELISETG